MSTTSERCDPHSGALMPGALTWLLERLAHSRARQSVCCLSVQCGLTARKTQPQPTHLECQGRRTDSRSDRPDTDTSRGSRCGRHHTRASCRRKFALGIWCQQLAPGAAAASMGGCATRTGRTDKRRGVIRRTRLRRLAASWMPALQGRRVLCRAAPDGVLFSARVCFCGSTRRLSCVWTSEPVNCLIS